MKKEPNRQSHRAEWGRDSEHAVSLYRTLLVEERQLARQRAWLIFETLVLQPIQIRYGEDI